MMRLITPYYFLLFTLPFFSLVANGQQSTSTTVDPVIVSEPVIRVVDYKRLKPIYKKENDTLYVVNFWATWCRPCIEELPDFMVVSDRFKDNKKFKMILVSLDDAEKANGTVKNFAKRLKLNVDNYLLDDIKKMNEWIPDVDSLWSGSIPATLFIKNGRSLRFVENSLDKDELESIIKIYL